MPQPQRTIRVAYQNLGGLSPDELQWAFRRAASYFPAPVEWMPLDQLGQPQQGDNYINFVHAAAPGMASVEAGGTAVPHRVWLFVDALRRATQAPNLNPLLGDTLAHELAHALGLQHTRSGIMASDFGYGMPIRGGFSKKQQAAILKALAQLEAADQ